MGIANNVKGKSYSQNKKEKKNEFLFWSSIRLRGIESQKQTQVKLLDHWK